MFDFDKAIAEIQDLKTERGALQGCLAWFVVGHKIGTVKIDAQNCTGAMFLEQARKLIGDE